MLTLFSFLLAESLDVHSYSKRHTSNVSVIIHEYIHTIHHRHGLIFKTSDFGTVNEDANFHD